VNIVTRFAPSPTGPLHLGHAFSAMVAHDMARSGGGAFLLRLEDIDQGRVRRQWEEAIFEDLAWLGLAWPRPVMRQSERLGCYRTALDRLAAMGLTYACTCSRRDIREAAAAPQEGAPLSGPDGLVYPGICKHSGHETEGAAIRLHMDRALARAGPIAYEETGDDASGRADVTPAAMLTRIGDVVLARRDIGTSYHLAVTVDDAVQGITHVTRGLDLAEATPIHVLLQRLLGLPTPLYHHHRLIRDDAGRRLAKRDDARAIRAYREEGATPGDLRRLTGLTLPAP
jgi:glutamyl-Q tRNA(Asp) synthetase